MTPFREPHVCKNRGSTAHSLQRPAVSLAETLLGMTETGGKGASGDWGASGDGVHG